MDLEIDLKDQTEEIDGLNVRYRKALKDKVTVYDELMKAVQMLARRNAEFMTNEIEICRLANMTSITKKELEQKERVQAELKQSIENHEEGARIAAEADQQVAQKQSRVEQLSNELYEKDQMIEQLSALLRQKEAQEQRIQGELDEGNKNDDEDAINKRNFGPTNVSKPKPPNMKYQFQRSDYAPQGIEPNNIMLDSRLATDMKSVSLPFPLIKLCDDQE